MAQMTYQDAAASDVAPYQDSPDLIDVASGDSKNPVQPSKKSSRDSRRSQRRAPPPPYSDDPDSAPATIYIFADDAAAEAQAAAARRSVVHDLLVILFQIVLLLMLGLMCYQFYVQFNADWRRTHMHIIEAEAERRIQILNNRALEMQKS